VGGKGPILVIWVKARAGLASHGTLGFGDRGGPLPTPAARPAAPPRSPARSYPPLEAIGDLNSTEVATLWDYQVRTGVRTARFAAWVMTVGFYPDFNSSGGGDVAMALTAAAPLGTSGIAQSAALSANGLWRRAAGLRRGAGRTCVASAAGWLPCSGLGNAALAPLCRIATRSLPHLPAPRRPPRAGPRA
jgi:hypothetical protein